MELKKVKNKNQETDGYGREKRPETEELKRKEITITETRKRNWNREKSRKAVRVSVKSVRRGARCFYLYLDVWTGHVELYCVVCVCCRRWDIWSSRACRRLIRTPALPSRCLRWAPATSECRRTSPADWCTTNSTSSVRTTRRRRSETSASSSTTRIRSRAPYVCTTNNNIHLYSPNEGRNNTDKNRQKDTHSGLKAK